MRENVIIKTIRSSEVDELSALAREIWTEHYPSIIGKNQTEYMLSNFHSQSNILLEIESGKVIYIAVSENEKLVAYSGYYHTDGGIFISKLYVHKSARKKGYAKALLSHILNQHPETDYLKLYVNRNNKESIKAYEKLGFTNQGTFLKEISDGYFYDDYIFQLDNPTI